MVAEQVPHGIACPNSPPVHPGTQIGRDRDVRRRRDDARREFGLVARDLVEQISERRLSRGLLLRRQGEFVGYGDPVGVKPALAALRKRHLTKKRAQFVRRDTQPFERLPLLVIANVHGVAKFRHLRFIHQAGMIVLVTGQRQAEAFDRVTEEADGTVLIDAFARLENARQVVTTQIRHERSQLIVAAPFEQFGELALVPEIVEQALPPRRRATLKGQSRVELVGRGVDPAL